MLQMHKKLSGLLSAMYRACASGLTVSLLECEQAPSMRLSLVKTVKSLSLIMTHRTTL
jgi:hypothetical protein